MRPRRPACLHGRAASPVSPIRGCPGCTTRRAWLTGCGNSWPDTGTTSAARVPPGCDGGRRQVAYQHPERLRTGRARAGARRRPPEAQKAFSLTTSYDRTACLWDLETSVERLGLSGHIETVTAAALLSLGTSTASWSEGGTAPCESGSRRPELRSISSTCRTGWTRWS